MSDTASVELVIEASTTAGSVALLRNRVLLGVHAVTMGSGASDVLFPAIMNLCRDADLTPMQLTRIICGEGPGSFTSLRIAASLAKGIAHGTGVSLAAVSSLVIAAGAGLSLPPGRYAVHADALRGERYVQWVDIRSEDVIGLGSAQRMTVAQLLAVTSNATRLAVGSSPDDLPGPVVVPSASALTRLHASCVHEVPVASWEPMYGRLAEAQVQWEQRHGTPLPMIAPTAS